ncbi:MAG: hypothetical protein KAQ83_00485, partial [Nanoarchaeota archaeon]|nr:hypothetical protein [Nanoarchaeota archaeon]
MSKKAHNKFVVITIVLIILILNLALISATNNSLNNTLNLSPNHSFNSTLNLTLNVTAPTLNVSINFSLNEFNVSINGTFNEFNNFDNDTNLTLNVTAPTLNVSINETPQITVKNSDNKEEKVEIKITEEVKKKETWNGNAKIHGLAKLGDRVENESKTYSIEIVPEDSPVEKIVLYDVEVQNETLGLDDVPEDIPAPHGEWEEVYAIDPTEINFTNATVTVTATGNILYKCEKWNFEDQSCGGEWVLFKEGLIPGQEYTFTLTPDDPGFGEINATSATHLDENKTAIRSIYNSIALADDVWSESIPQEHHVRITFEKELDNGNMIDVVAASNNTYAYFEVLVAGTEDIVGRSSAFGPEELQYIEINGLDEPTDTFDFKIIKSEYNAEDNSSEIDPNEISFITFDYIHDEAITPTSAEGIIVYQEQDVPTPHYRLWNSSTNDFGSELNANSVS